MRTEGESSVIITARACPVPPALLAQALSEGSLQVVIVGNAVEGLKRFASAFIDAHE
jgi:hypothetical protein